VGKVDYATTYIGLAPGEITSAGPARFPNEAMGSRAVVVLREGDTMGLRADRRARAAKKRHNVQCYTADYLAARMGEGMSNYDSLMKTDAMLQRRIRETPQEASLVRAAARDLFDQIFR
jgi:hypothetical protein